MTASLGQFSLIHIGL